MIGDKYEYSEYKINGQYSTSLGCSVTATMGNSVSENENDGKLDTHILAATHKLKRALSPVLNNSSSKNSGNILPRLDEHTHVVKGLFVDIEKQEWFNGGNDVPEISQKNFAPMFEGVYFFQSKYNKP